MNSAEAMMLREDAANEYLRLIDECFANRYPDRIDIAMMIKMNWESSLEGACTINEALAETLEILDEMDEDDAFGTWGWRHSVMGED